MIVKYPQVNEEGADIVGSEVSFRFELITAINRMWRYNYERRDDNNREILEIVPNCCNVTLGTHCEFQIKANYEELVERWMRLNEPQYEREIVE